MWLTDFWKIHARLVLTGMYRGLSLNCYNEHFISALKVKKTRRCAFTRTLLPIPSSFMKQSSPRQVNQVSLGIQIPVPLWNAGVHYQVSPWVADWVHNVSRLCLFFCSPEWCRLTGLPVFFVCSLWSVETELSLCNECIVFKYAILSSNLTRPSCTDAGSVCQTAEDRKTDLKCCQCSLGMGMQWPLYKDSSKIMQHLQGTTIVQTLISGRFHPS
jgi:hypothetical protein